MRSLSGKIDLAITLLIGLVIALILYLPLDPDLWWHLKVGQQVLAGTFPSRDNFSFTMSGYPWIDHEWLTQGVMFALYRIGGLLLLGCSFVFIFLTAFYLAIRLGRVLARQNNPALKSYPRMLELILLVIGLLVSNMILGTRPQMITLLGFAITNLILWKYALHLEDKTKWLPFIFLLWVNLHGGYLIGLALVLLFVIPAVLVNFFASPGTKKSIGVLDLPQCKHLSLIFFLCLLACLANPYGIRIFAESYLTALDGYARSHIAEWQAINIQEAWGLLVCIYIGLLALVVTASKQKMHFYYYFQLPFFVYLAMSSSRHVPLLILLSLPLLYTLSQDITPVADFCSQGYKKIFSTKFRRPYSLVLNTILMVCVVSLVLAKCIDFYFAGNDAAYRSQRGKEPRAAVLFMQEHSTSGNILNLYGWGGYLIWHLPERKIFIDGRMASWRDEDTHILKTYQTIINQGKGWTELLQKYQIREVLMPPDSSLANTLPYLNGWQEVYRDDIAVVLHKQ